MLSISRPTAAPRTSFVIQQSVTLTRLTSLDPIRKKNNDKPFLFSVFNNFTAHSNLVKFENETLSRS